MTEATFLHVIFFSLVGGVFALIGGVILLSKRSWAEKLALVAAPFAAGALLAAAFFDLLPEAAHHIGSENAAVWVLGGILLFFMLEYFLKWFHHHHEHEERSEKSPAYLIIIGDTLHNLLDGIAIGAAFLISVPTGIVVTIAVAAHEIPQEIGDFGILLKYGFRRRIVLLINAVSAMAATVGAVVTFWIGTSHDIPIGVLLAITAGMFIYIAASDLIPTIHAESRQKVRHIAAALLIAGVGVVALATNLAHDYIDTGHDHDNSQHDHDDHESSEQGDHDDHDDHHHD